MEKIGYGIFTWNGSERRSQRYGNFHLSQADFGNTVLTPFLLDQEALRPYLGRKVELILEVNDNRESGHIGDLFLGISPTKPEIGERIVLGVGVLRVGLVPAWDNTVAPSIGLEPEDGRPCYWIDPNLLYRLHDQTVTVYLVPADDRPCHPAPAMETPEPGVKSVGDGSFQTVNISPDNLYIHPKVTRLGDGLFQVSSDHAFGESVSFTNRK